jgi:hypothetical protein
MKHESCPMVVRFVGARAWREVGMGKAGADYLTDGEKYFDTGISLVGNDRPD